MNKLSRILITGSDGYIGAVLIKYLSSRNYYLGKIDIGYFYDCTLGDYSEISLNRGFFNAFNYTSDISSLTLENLKYYDAVIHLAALSNDSLGELDEKATNKINIVSSIRLAELAKKAGIKEFFFASSCSVYGGVGDTDEGGITETGKLDPLTNYARSKVIAEDLLKSLASDEFKVTVLRFATIYGASPKLRTDLVVNSMVGSGLLFNQVRINNDGEALRPLLHVQDLCEAIYRLLQLGDLEPFTVLNIGSKNYAVREVATTVADILNCHLVYDSPESKDFRTYRVNFDKLKHLLGWEPAISLNIGIRELISFYSTNLLTERDFKHKFIRISWLKEQIQKGLVSL